MAALVPLSLLVGAVLSWLIGPSSAWTALIWWSLGSCVSLVLLLVALACWRVRQQPTEVRALLRHGGRDQ